MVSGMKVGWLVVGAVCLFSLLAIAASGPATVSLLDESASLDEPSLWEVSSRWFVPVPAAPSEPAEPTPPQPTVIRLQPASSSPSPGQPCRPCAAVDEPPVESFVPHLVAEPASKHGERLLRLLFPVAAEPEQTVPQLAAPPVPLPDGLYRR